MRSSHSTRTSCSDLSDFRKNNAGVTFDGGPGKDLVLGSSFADDLKGGSGRDALFGFCGADTLEGGAGLDVAAGGAGDDTFVFRPGDLVTSRGRSNGHCGLVDAVLDFCGAGTSGTGEQDVLRFEGFGSGTTLSFIGHGPSRSLQLYEVVDPTTPGDDGFVFVAMADGRHRITAKDVAWGPGAEPTLDFVTANRIDDTFSVRLGDGQGGFGGGSDLDKGGGYRLLALGDLDGDGDLDFIMPENFGEGVGGSVTVRLNDGSGGFDEASDVAVTEAAGDIALGDLDGDGDLDYATANYDSGSVSVRLGNGDGTFDGGSEVATGSAVALALGDLDGDGDLDVATANSDDGDNYSVSLRLNNGDGTFGGGSELAVGNGPTEVALGDLDGDGDLDLAAVNTHDDTVSVRMNDGSGTFGGGSEVALGNGVADLALGDLDGDGDLDLAVANRNGGTVSIRLNDGSGTFDGGSEVAIDSPGSVALGDFDDDGDLDLVASNSQGSTVSVRLNDGSGTFGGGSEVAVGYGAGSLVLGDLDGAARLTPSGLPDLGPLVPTPAEIDAAWA
ncbi:FG-GAP-like repeat-containing protein [Paracoccus benzoatiresistens]|uniref:FG-GAP-like repeat-containing protein n=1 Tax=Paracoccus benzoatiresistens TaxID=2997341 RepID=A0ABT4JCA0_9RHOB|nr:FG-GAP-like repeat-containing protein [Paracoccus sp. EF6]MCZ0964340.1 FG-GAP-like repeat-containing protein [Paracoccus sp. EF6]